jgi:hypothetical protein
VSAVAGVVAQVTSAVAGITSAVTGTSTSPSVVHSLLKYLLGP